MIRVISQIALNTFRETVRDKILYLLIGFSILIIAASLLAASISLGQDTRVIESFGLTAMLVFLLIISLFIGTQLVYREKDRKTIYFVLSKPISRESFYLGKYLGLVITILVATAVMTVVLIGLLHWRTNAHFLPVVLASFFILLEVWLVVAVSLLFSSFTSPLASSVYSFCLVLIGHSATNIWTIAQKSGRPLRLILEAVYYLFPNLEKFNLRNEVVYSLTPQPIQIITVIIYFLAYTTALILLGMAVIRRDEF